MKIQMEESLPIYVQIMNRIRRSIISGEKQPGERMASVRELAGMFQVNPNTMQRALAELEREGILYSERTSGRFVTKNTALIREARSREARQAVQRFAEQMEDMGITEAEYLHLFREIRHRQKDLG